MKTEVERSFIVQLSMKGAAYTQDLAADENPNQGGMSKIEGGRRGGDQG